MKQPKHQINNKSHDVNKEDRELAQKSEICMLRKYRRPDI